MIKQLVLLFAFVAVALSQQIVTIDDFTVTVPTDQATLRISSLSTVTVESSACDAAGDSSIIGGCHTLFLTGFADSGCEPTGSIARGSMFCNNAFSCGAECTLQIDGQDQTAERTFSLNEDLLDKGFAFRIFAATDIATSFTIRVYSSSSAVSKASGSIPAGSSQSAETFVEYEFNFGTDFTGNADFQAVTMVEIVVPNKFDTDVVLTDWHILTQEADVGGNVFVDCNCNNNRDGDDTSISNAEVTLTGDSSCAIGTRTQTTGATGNYLFTGLPPCTYTVQVNTAQTGALCSSSSNPRTVNLGSTSILNVNFGTDVPTTFTVPPNRVVACTESTSPNALGEATSSQCGATSSVGFTDNIEGRNCDADYTIIRTWTDANGASGVQTITVQDTNVAPTFTNADASTLDQTISCNGCIEVGTCIPALNAVDDCSVVTVTHSDGSRAQDCGADCVSRFTFVRTWAAVDDCGNQAANQGQVISETCGMGEVISCPTLVVPQPNSPASFSPASPAPVPRTNPPTRNCRFICDDDDSSASAAVVSVLLVALMALAAF